MFISKPWTQAQEDSRKVNLSLVFEHAHNFATEIMYMQCIFSMLLCVEVI